MRRLAFTGFMIAGGFVAGLLVVSANALVGGFMGAVLGGVCAVMVHSFPRTHDYPEHDNWFRD